MDERIIRAGMLLGESAMEKLRRSHVAVLGLGGVGSWCAEGLARCGVALKSTTGRENCVAVLCKTEDDPRGSRDTLQRH